MGAADAHVNQYTVEHKNVITNCVSERHGDE